MSRTLTAMILTLALASCGGGHKPPPSNLDDACSIVTERAEYKKAFKATEKKWGVPAHVQMATIYQESGYRADARTPFRYVLDVIPMGRQSSAYGYSQAIDATWDLYRKETGRSNAKRDRISDAADFMGWYMVRSNRMNGISLGDARNQYLAYHEGQSGYGRGSHRDKSWLLRVADSVQARADMYRDQLVSCRRY